MLREHTFFKSKARESSITQILSSKHKIAIACNQWWESGDFWPAGSGTFLTESGSYPLLIIHDKNGIYSLKINKYSGNIQIISLLSYIIKSIKNNKTFPHEIFRIF